MSKTVTTKEAEKELCGPYDLCRQPCR